VTLLEVRSAYLFLYQEGVTLASTSSRYGLLVLLYANLRLFRKS